MATPVRSLRPTRPTRSVQPAFTPAPPNQASRQALANVERRLNDAYASSRPREGFARARELILAESARLERTGQLEIGMLDQPKLETAWFLYENGYQQAASELLGMVSNPKLKITGWMKLLSGGHANAFRPMLRVAEECREDPLLQEALLGDMRDALAGNQDFARARAVEAERQQLLERRQQRTT